MSGKVNIFHFPVFGSLSFPAKPHSHGYEIPVERGENQTHLDRGFVKSIPGIRLMRFIIPNVSLLVSSNK